MSNIVSVSSSSCPRSTIIHSHSHGSKINLTRRFLLRQTDQSLPFPSTNLRRRSSHITISRDMAIHSGQGFGSLPLPSPPPGTPWKLWIVGMVIAAIVPFWKNKWWPLLRLKQNVDEVVDAAEDVAEMVETAAERVEKVAEEVAEHLPHGGKLKKAALFVENAAKRVSKDADLAEQIIDKIEEVEDEVISLFKENGETKEEDAKQKKDQK